LLRTPAPERMFMLFVLCAVVLCLPDKMLGKP
jgi:hypothetical protein